MKIVSFRLELNWLRFLGDNPAKKMARSLLNTVNPRYPRFGLFTGAVLKIGENHK